MFFASGPAIERGQAFYIFYKQDSGSMFFPSDLSPSLTRGTSRFSKETGRGSLGFFGILIAWFCQLFTSGLLVLYGDARNTRN